MISYSIDEWCKMHGFSRSFFYKLQQTGEGPQTFKVGNRTRISDDANRYWVASKEAEASRGLLFSLTPEQHRDIAQMDPGPAASIGHKPGARRR